MINSDVFFTEYTKLCKYFGKAVAPEQLPVLKEILSEALDTMEFLTACRNAISDNPFFPTPRWLIDSVLGTFEDRATIQLQNLDRLSVVGRQAMEAIGGAWAFRKSERPELVKKDFIASYLAFAKNASPDDLRMPATAAIALSPAQKESPAPQSRPMTLADKEGILRCKCNLESQRPGAWAEANRYGFRVDMGFDVAENQRITLSPGQNPNEILQESPEDFEATVRSLTASLAGTAKHPLEF